MNICGHSLVVDRRVLGVTRGLDRENGFMSQQADQLIHHANKNRNVANKTIEG